MSTLALPWRFSLGTQAYIESIALRLSKRKRVVALQRELQQKSDYLLEDIGITRRDIPSISCGGMRPSAEAASRAMEAVFTTAALNKAEFHTGK